MTGSSANRNSFAVLQDLPSEAPATGQPGVGRRAQKKRERAAQHRSQVETALPWTPTSYDSSQTFMSLEHLSLQDSAEPTYMAYQPFSEDGIYMGDSASEAPQEPWSPTTCAEDAAAWQQLMGQAMQTAAAPALPADLAAFFPSAVVEAAVQPARLPPAQPQAPRTPPPAARASKPVEDWPGLPPPSPAPAPAAATPEGVAPARASGRSARGRARSKPDTGIRLLRRAGSASTAGGYDGLDDALELLKMHRVERDGSDGPQHYAPAVGTEQQRAVELERARVLAEFQPGQHPSKEVMAAIMHRAGQRKVSNTSSSDEEEDECGWRNSGRQLWKLMVDRGWHPSHGGGGHTKWTRVLPDGLVQTIMTPSSPHGDRWIEYLRSNLRNSDHEKAARLLQSAG